MLLINFMKDKRNECDDEEVMIYFGFNNENIGKEQRIVIMRLI